jgi:hypothetical protein
MRVSSALRAGPCPLPLLATALHQAHTQRAELQPRMGRPLNERVTRRRASLEEKP